VKEKVLDFMFSLFIILLAISISYLIILVLSYGLIWAFDLPYQPWKFAFGAMILAGLLNMLRG